MTQSVEEQWICRAMTLQEGEQIYLPILDEKDMKEKIQKLKASKTRMMKDEERILEVSRIEISKDLKDDRRWIVLTKKAHSPLVGYIKRVDGRVEKISVAVDRQRERMLSLMAEDGLSIDEVNDQIDDPLTEDEKLKFFSEEILRKLGIDHSNFNS